MILKTLLLHPLPRFGLPAVLFLAKVLAPTPMLQGLSRLGRPR